MMTTAKPLRPPLAPLDRKPREQHLNREAPLLKNRAAAPVKAAPSPSQAATPHPGNEDYQAPPSGPRSSRRPFTCRECRTKTPWPAAGWYSLDRRIVPGSVPPDILCEAERRTWARLNRQWMGIYCSMACLRRSMERLEGLDRMFRERGIGTRLAGPFG